MENWSVSVSLESFINYKEKEEDGGRAVEKGYRREEIIILNIPAGLCSKGLSQFLFVCLFRLQLESGILSNNPTQSASWRDRGTNSCQAQLSILGIPIPSEETSDPLTPPSSLDGPLR